MKKKLVKGSMKGTYKELVREANKLTKDEVIHIRVRKNRKEEIRSRAQRAGVSISEYLLLAEDKFAHLK